MQFFIALIFCSLTPVIFAVEYYNESTKCKCVARELCSYKFSPLIEPRSPRYSCPGNTVCCKPEHLIPDSDSIYDDITVDNHDEVLLQKTVTVPSKCGLRTKISAYKRLVIPASLAALGEFPWQAAILRNYSRGYVFVSSGVLVDTNIIVTTAHNVLDLTAKDILIRLGENNVQADPKRRFHHVNVKTNRIMVKDDFNVDTLENDLAVLCLVKKVKCNEVVSPICLPDPKIPIDDTSSCVVSGWGKGSHNGSYSSILRKTNLKLVSFNKCQYLIRKRISDPSYMLDPSFVCAGGEFGKDACTGDAGGPLSCLNSETGQQILRGIVSWGIGCGEQDVPGVYSDIRHPPNLKFIRDAINECNKRNYNTNAVSTVEYIDDTPNLIGNSNAQLASNLIRPSAALSNIQANVNLNRLKDAILNANLNAKVDHSKNVNLNRLKGAILNANLNANLDLLNNAKLNHPNLNHGNIDRHNNANFNNEVLDRLNSGFIRRNHRLFDVNQNFED